MLQKQVDNIEKQRNYLMRKLQQTKNNMESDKFRLLKDFEVEKLDLLKKIEELLMLNDILAGQRVIYDARGQKIDTQEILDMLNPFQLLQSIHGRQGVLTRTARNRRGHEKRGKTRRGHPRHCEQPGAEVHWVQRCHLHHSRSPASSNYSGAARAADERRWTHQTRGRCSREC